MSLHCDKRRFAAHAVSIFLLLHSVVATAADAIADRQRELQRTTGTIKGKVIDAETGEPLSDVSLMGVDTGMGDSSDATGAFEVVYLDPGTVKLEASRRDLVTASQVVTVAAGQTTTVEFKMQRAARACCRLEGEWNVSLTLDKAPADVRAEKHVEGVVRFSSSIPDPIANRHRTPGDPTVDEFGEYKIDLRPFFGPNITKAVTNSIVPGTDENLLSQVEGAVYNANEVEINFIPRMSHGGISLTGQLDGDTIRGTWLKRDYVPVFEGTFVMTRAVRKNEKQR